MHFEIKDYADQDTVDIGSGLAFLDHDGDLNIVVDDPDNDGVTMAVCLTKTPCTGPFVINRGEDNIRESIVAVIAPGTPITLTV